MTDSPIVPNASAPVAVFRGTDPRIPPLRPYFARLWASRALIANLARTDLKARHYDTVLGQLWLVLGPLLLAGVYLLVRLVLRPAGGADAARAIAAQMVMAVFVFQFVSGIVVSGAGSILGNKSLLLNSSTHRLVYPTVTTTESVFDLGTMLIVLAVVWIVLRQPFSPWMLLFPVVIGLVSLFAYGLALAAATAAVYFRDTVNLLGYFMRIWLFVTPVLYTVNEIPDGIRNVFALNPLYPFFAILNSIFAGTRPHAIYFVWCAAWAAVSLFVGLGWFIAKERDFALRIY